MMSPEVNSSPISVEKHAHQLPHILPSLLSRRVFTGTPQGHAPFCSFTIMLRSISSLALLLNNSRFARPDE